MLEDVKLPKDIVQISQFTFASCEKIKELTLPEGLYNCQEVAKEVPANKAKYGLGKRCFFGCEALTTLFVPCAPEKLYRSVW